MRTEERALARGRGKKRENKGFSRQQGKRAVEEKKITDFARRRSSAPRNKGRDRLFPLSAVKGGGKKAESSGRGEKKKQRAARSYSDSARLYEKERRRSSMICLRDVRKKHTQKGRRQHHLSPRSGKKGDTDILEMANFCEFRGGGL